MTEDPEVNTENKGDEQSEGEYLPNKTETNLSLHIQNENGKFFSSIPFYYKKKKDEVLSVPVPTRPAAPISALGHFYVDYPPLSSSSSSLSVEQKDEKKQKDQKEEKKKEKQWETLTEKQKASYHQAAEKDREKFIKNYKNYQEQIKHFLQAVESQQHARKAELNRQKSL